VLLRDLSQKVRSRYWLREVHVEVNFLTLIEVIADADHLLAT
jgi:hypothetical protein